MEAECTLDEMGHEQLSSAIAKTKQEIGALETQLKDVKAEMKENFNLLIVYDRLLVNANERAIKCEGSASVAGDDPPLMHNLMWLFSRTAAKQVEFVESEKKLEADIERRKEHLDALLAERQSR